MMVRSTHDQQSLEHGRAGLPVYIAAGCRAQVPADHREQMAGLRQAVDGRRGTNEPNAAGEGRTGTEG